MEKNVLQHGLLVVHGCIKIKPEHCLQFIPKNPFMQDMLQLLSDEESSDISFKVESRPLLGKFESCSTAFSKVFSAHKFVLKTCAKGQRIHSYLAV